MQDPAPRPPLTDDDARRIAERIILELTQPPGPDNRDTCSPPPGSQSPEDADEDRMSGH
jgi:hypothetical protein